MMHDAPRKKREGIEYHFAGSGIYHPHVVTAASQEEAVKIWEKERVAYVQAPKEEKEAPVTPETEEINT